MRGESMQPAKMRGHAFASTLKYCREVLPLERRKKLFERLSADTLGSIESMQANEWYTIDYLAAMLDAMVAASDGNAATAEQDLVGVGKFIGKEAATTFLRLMMKVLTPSLFAKKLQAIYLRYNSTGTLTVDVRDDRMVVSFTGTKGFPHLAAIVVGWLSMVFEMMGKELVSYKITNWSLTSPYNDCFDLELVWRT